MPRSDDQAHAFPRCGAKTRGVRDGKSCQSYPVAGRRRCRMHGGAPGTGAPLGNRNAGKHGLRSREFVELRSEVMRILRTARKLLAKL